jgi:hypothetical protein
MLKNNKKSERYMEKEFDRVRCSSSANMNKDIENKILINLKNNENASSDKITERIIELEKEWSMERWLELNASTLAFIGLLLGVFVNIYWLFFPGLVLPFLALHAIQGWCPPIPIMRKLNIRTRREIDWEKFTLKFIRGDFDTLGSIKNIETIFHSVKKNV